MKKMSGESGSDTVCVCVYALAYNNTNILSICDRARVCVCVYVHFSLTNDEK